MAKSLTGKVGIIKTRFDDLPNNPLHLLQDWLNQSIAINVSEPNSLVLSTVNKENRPSSRVVYMKSVDDTGVIFASSANSKKGNDIANNTNVAGNLYWRESIQQINFQGYVSVLDDSISDKLFSERTRGAQAVATLSQQSFVLDDKENLKSALNSLFNSEQEISRPTGWHGYHITIDAIEFWQGHPDRFHERVNYELINDVWKFVLLQP